MFVKSSKIVRFLIVLFLFGLFVGFAFEAILGLLTYRSINAFVSKIVYPIDYDKTVVMKSRNEKLILQWTTIFSRDRLQPGSGYFDLHCPGNNRCTISQDKQLLMSADALVCHVSSLILLPPIHPPNQSWVFFELETPPSKAVFGVWSPSWLEEIFNVSATYSSSSDFHFPYVACEDKPTEEDWRSLVAPQEKKKQVLWFMSSKCSGSRRMKYYNELKQHINIDFYGKCGKPDPCQRNNGCLLKLTSSYKFYLAFENSECNEYITEKMINPIKWGLIPIALGAPMKDYAAIFPEGSFLHVDNFTSPSDLAKYLHYLDHNDEAYNHYHLWREKHRCGDGFSIWPNGKWLCQLCDHLWDPKRLSQRRTMNVSEVHGLKNCKPAH